MLLDELSLIMHCLGVTKADSSPNQCCACHFILILMDYEMCNQSPSTPQTDYAKTANAIFSRWRKLKLEITKKNPCSKEEAQQQTQPISDWWSLVWHWCTIISQTAVSPFVIVVYGGGGRG